jgi:hypothetical protein
MHITVIHPWLRLSNIKISTSNRLIVMFFTEAWQVAVASRLLVRFLLLLSLYLPSLRHNQASVTSSQLGGTVPTKSSFRHYRWFVLLLVALACLVPMQFSTPVTAQGPQLRLGELRVDWYCLQRGNSAWIVNNNTNWACTAPNGSITIVLGPTDLNSVCQGFYKNTAAYAVRDRTSSAPALDWSCYVLNPATSTPVLEPRRLGEFQVEWYCNERGLGVRVINNDADWACTQPNNGQVSFVLQQENFNEICRRTYGNSNAYARRDQSKPQPAYNWSCYVDVPVTATRTPFPSPVPTNPPRLTRLGEFQVEWYCNERGWGVKLINNDADWACTDPKTNATVQVLSKADFDTICKRTYNDQTAVAIRDLQKPQAAYTWSCYSQR